MSVFSFNDVASREWAAGGDGECTTGCQYENVSISRCNVNARGCAGQHTVKHRTSKASGVGAAVVQYIFRTIASSCACYLGTKGLS